MTRVASVYNTPRCGLCTAGTKKTVPSCKEHPGTDNRSIKNKKKVERATAHLIAYLYTRVLKIATPGCDLVDACRYCVRHTTVWAGYTRVLKIATPGCDLLDACRYCVRHTTVWVRCGLHKKWSHRVKHTSVLKTAPGCETHSIGFYCVSHTPVWITV